MSTNRKIIMKSRSVLKCRLWFYVLALLHLNVMGLYLLSIDFSQSTHAVVRKYQHVKWKLITTWFNLLSIVWLGIAAYCDYKILQDESNRKSLESLRRIKNKIFSSIVAPVTAFSDVLFWSLWNQDRELVVPIEVDAWVQPWMQHSMHTVSLVVVIVDLLLVPRRRPKSMKSDITWLSTFYVLYDAVLTHSVISEGEFVYPVLKNMSHTFLILLLFNYVAVMFWYTVQWCVVDLIWGPNGKNIYQIISHASEVKVYMRVPKWLYTSITLWSK